ncbi:MAG: TolC family outer membrane protein [Alphaproteobacteria bacterium]
MFTGRVYAVDGEEYIGLEDVFIRVYEGHPTLQAAREELKAVQELYPQARAGWLPSLDAEAGIFSTKVESSNFGAGDGATTKDLTLSLDQPLWRGGRTFAETARAHDLIRAGEAVLSGAVQSLFLDAATSYMDVLRDQDLFELRRQSEHILLQDYYAVREREKLGSATVTDILQTRVRLERAKSQRIDAHNNLSRSLAAFQNIMAVWPPYILEAPQHDFEFSGDMAEMVAVAEERNPELLIAKYEYDAAKHHSDAVFRELLPQVAAFASYNKQYDPQPGIVEESETQSVGVRMTLALYRGGGTRSRIREAKRNFKQREYEISEIRREIQQEIVSHWRSYKAAQAESFIRMREIEAAQAALQGVREEFVLGQRVMLDILDADEELINARVAFTRARRNESVTGFALAKSLGFLSPAALGVVQAGRVE